MVHTLKSLINEAQKAACLKLKIIKLIKTDHLPFSDINFSFISKPYI